MCCQQSTPVRGLARAQYGAPRITRSVSGYDYAQGLVPPEFTHLLGFWKDRVQFHKEGEKVRVTGLLGDKEISKEKDLALLFGYSGTELDILAVPHEPYITKGKYFTLSMMTRMPMQLTEFSTGMALKDTIVVKNSFSGTRNEFKIMVDIYKKTKVPYDICFLFAALAENGIVHYYSYGPVTYLTSRSGPRGNARYKLLKACPAFLNPIMFQGTVEIRESPVKHYVEAPVPWAPGEAPVVEDLGGFVDPK